MVGGCDRPAVGWTWRGDEPEVGWCRHEVEERDSRTLPPIARLVTCRPGKGPRSTESGRRGSRRGWWGGHGGETEPEVGWCRHEVEERDSRTLPPIARLVTCRPGKGPRSTGLFTILFGLFIKTN
jgi:hypothetical protein